METRQALRQTPEGPCARHVASLSLWFHMCKIWDNTTYPEGLLQEQKPCPQSPPPSVRHLTRSSVSDSRCGVWALGSELVGPESHLCHLPAV